MAIGVTAKLTAREGHSDQFEALFKELQDEVNAQEPGCLFYAVHKSRSNPLEYIVLEQYQDQQAAEAHQKARQKEGRRGCASRNLCRGARTGAHSYSH